MNVKKRKTVRRPAGADSTGVEALYASLLTAFYDRQNLAEARRHGRRLQTMLRKDSAVAESIRGQEIASLIAELRGDLEEAIRYRESEIRKIFELHSVTRDTPHWAYAFRQYDYRDISDRLDLLALLYADRGDAQRALATLRESKQFCQALRIPFDGQDILDELESSQASEPSGNGKQRRSG